MTSTHSRPEFISPRSILEGCLPELLVVQGHKRDPACKLGEWKNFEEEVDKFYKDDKLQNAFKSCDQVATAENLPYLEKHVTRHYAGLEHTLIAEERELHGRFLNNVTKPLYAALNVLLDVDHVPKKEIAALKTLPLSRNLHIGSAKLVPAVNRDNKEPDIIFLMPKDGMSSRARVVGELKFSGTCRLSDAWDDLKSRRYLSMRHKLGQVARDMRLSGTRFGFISTYEETVFLKIVKDTDGAYALLRSKCYSSRDTADYDRDQKKLNRINVPMGLMLLIHKISHEPELVWAFDPGNIDKHKWVDEKASPEPGELAGPYDTPYNQERDRIPAVFNNPSVDSRPAHTAALGQSATPSRIPRPTVANATSLHRSLEQLTISSPRPGSYTTTTRTAVAPLVPQTIRQWKVPGYAMSARNTRSASRAAAAKAKTNAGDDE